MIGVDASGMKVIKGETRDGQYDGHSPGIDELTGLGRQAERDGAIIALSLRCGWSSERLADLFHLTDRHVRRIVAAFRAEFEESR